MKHLCVVIQQRTQEALQHRQQIFHFRNLTLLSHLRHAIWIYMSK